MNHLPSRYCVKIEHCAQPPTNDEVGGKGAGLLRLAQGGFRALPAFAVTTRAYAEFIGEARISCALRDLTSAVSSGSSEADTSALSARICKLISEAKLPVEIMREVARHAGEVARSDDPRFAVRSSCTFEDQTDISSAGIYESYINCRREKLEAFIKRCYASLFSRRAIEYSRAHGTPLQERRMAVVIQPAIEPHAAGVAFSSEPDTGFTGNIVIQSVLGQGMGVVDGHAVPDTYIVNKRVRGIVRRQISSKPSRLVFHQDGGLVEVPNERELAAAPSLTDEQALRLASVVVGVAEVESGHVDVEWALTSEGEIVLLQVRPLRVPDTRHFIEYRLTSRGAETLVTGQPITDKIVTGEVVKVRHPHDAPARGRIVVVPHIDVDWLPVLREAAGVVTEGGGYTSHIAIVLREMGLPALFGAAGAWDVLDDTETVTLVCNERPGRVLRGSHSFTVTQRDVADVPVTRTKIHLVTSAVEGLDRHLCFPVNGIGLVRLEFLIANAIGIHPLAVLAFDEGAAMPDELRAHIQAKIGTYKTAREYYVTTLCDAICVFASRCTDSVINVRAADLLTDDYLTLLGGDRFEVVREANPMLGWRGLTRLIDPDYVRAFQLDCEGFKMAVEERGFSGINMLLPFCRAPEDVERAREIIRRYGPARTRVGMMVEVPASVVLAREFAAHADFFLVGPMDLTQLTYGADRKSEKLGWYNDQTTATKEMVKIFLSRIRGLGRTVFIGGWPLYQYLEEYLPLLGNTKLHLVELPDRLAEVFSHVHEMETRLFGASAEDRAQLAIT